MRQTRQDCLSLMPRGHAHWALTINITDIWVCPNRHQNPGDVIETFKNGQMQRSDAIVSLHVDICASLSQPQDDLSKAFFGSNVKRCDTLSRAGAHAPSLSQKQIHHLSVSFLDGNVQRRQAICSCYIWIRPEADE
mmetsp:Transcript_39267/g.91765  ORF Transcript_39267/g.91765 Transcript_39267/m.91765 type:complete len:136 (+) Transcript_39267:333-740(+)